MKTLKHLATVAIFSSLLLACASPVYIQKDESANFANYKTYLWVNTAKDQDDKKTRPNSFADISVRNEANKALTLVGWKEVTENPDILLSYDILVERTTQKQSDPVYSQPTTRMYYNPYTKRWSSIYYPSQFLGYDTYETPVKEGTITITMMDAKTDKEVWQGWTTDQLSTTRLTSDQVAKAVSDIFKKFKP